MPEANGEDDFSFDDIKIHSAEVVDKPTQGPPYARPVEIIIEATAWSHMNHHAREDLRHEAGGVMLGGIYEHAGNLVVRITTAVAARGAVNNMASIQFTYDAWSQMEKERQQRAPEEKLVGWYHTHPGFSAFFSDTDRFMHEHFFTQPWHVALVIDPVRGEHCLFRWDDGRVQEVTAFLLQVDHWPGPQPPLNAVLSTALRQAVRQVEREDAEGAHSFGPALGLLIRSLRRGSSEKPLADLLPFIVACAELEPQVLAEARRRMQIEAPPDSPIRYADLESCSENPWSEGAISIAHGWLAQQNDQRSLHVHSLEVEQSTAFCTTELHVPLQIHDLTINERRNLLALTRDRDQPLYCIEPSLPELRSARVSGARPITTASVVEIDWGGRVPARKIGKILAACRDLYLLTRNEVWVLASRGTGEVSRFECVGVHSSSVCGWASFAELIDWTTDLAGNLYVLNAEQKEVWRFERLTERWSCFVADANLDDPRSLAAGMTELSVYDGGHDPAIAKYDLADGRLQCRRRLDPDVQRLRIWHLFSDGYHRLYLVTDRYIFQVQ